jgi:hypothetical protein
MKIHESTRVVASLALFVALSACSGSKPAEQQEGVKVTDIAVGRSVAADKTIAEKTDSFRPADTIYVSVKTDGSAPSATLTARWMYEDGQLVDESRQNIAPTAGATVTEFHLSKPDGWPAGVYTVEVLLNGATAGTKDFKVEQAS